MSKIKFKKIIAEAFENVGGVFTHKPIGQGEGYRTSSKQKINETLPAFAKEWKNLEKACDEVYKANDALAKAVGRVDKKYEREVKGLSKYVTSHLKKFKDLLSKEVLNKLQ